jgi:hypothetical protein
MRLPLLLLATLASCEAPPRTDTAALYPPPPFCTRTLGMASCFADPASLTDHPSSLGDTPYRPVQPALPWWRKVTNHWDDQASP